MINYLQIENLSKSFGEDVLFSDVTFTLHKDQKLALIAKNGTGKSTLLNIISGKDIPDSGKITFRKDIKVSYLEQIPFFVLEDNIIDHIFRSSDNISNIIKRYQQAIILGDSDLIQKASEEMDLAEAWDYEHKIIEILDKLKISNFNQQIKTLSGGEKRRLALAAALIEKADVLILDEPTNHLDLQMIDWLEKYLKSEKISLLMVTHDRYFLDIVCDEIVEIDMKKSFLYKGNYQYYIEKRAARYSQMQTEIEKANNLYKKELDWMRRMPQARSTKAKYRIENFYKIEEKANISIDEENQNIDIKTSRLGKKVLDIYDISKSFENKILIKSFSYKFGRKEKIGIVGPNGSGKSTFLNIITGNILPDKGTIEKGSTVVFGYYTQGGLVFDNEKRMIDIIKDISEFIPVGKNSNMSAAQFLEYFQFDREKHYSYVSKLSGGERKRLYLMTVLMRNPNFLILDEPTNDFDIQTLNVLEEYLKNFDGNVLIVSHDRYFMDKLVDSLFVIEDGGNIFNFPGNYYDYIQYKSLQDKEIRQLEKKQKEIKEEKKPQKKKFGFNEQREFDNLEKELKELEERKSNIEISLNSGELVENELIKISEEYAQISKIIDKKEMRWLELSELKD
ncbi:MAG: ABC-F family ATP-binding cassette domain-containing protein [Bacteroidales bacterium]|nr:ABC-F family ATP-binding cassette domain-containing protein [Bacteroidales bacterium]MBN2757422.1 ABC-F family ATP-binding cassette domain-containing protein [Bacteroidales bacterium]